MIFIDQLFVRIQTNKDMLYEDPIFLMHFFSSPRMIFLV